MSIEGDTQFEIIALYILSNLVTIIDFFSYTNRLQTNYATNFYQFILIYNFVSFNRKQTFAICLSLIPIQVRVPY